jgi:hypothetical protein
MTTVILTWRLLFLHDDCYSYMTTVILTWRLLFQITWWLLFLHDDCYSYMTSVIPDYMMTVILTWRLLFQLTWRLLFLHDDCYSYMTTVLPNYMTTVILTWRLLFQKLHDHCYSYMMTVIPEARRLHLDIPILLISIDQHWRGGFNLFNPTQSILNNLGIGRFAHLSGEGISYFYAPWIHPGFNDSLIQNQITAFLY